MVRKTSQSYVGAFAILRCFPLGFVVFPLAGLYHTLACLKGTNSGAVFRNGTPQHSSRPYLTLQLIVAVLASFDVSTKTADWLAGSVVCLAFKEGEETNPPIVGFQNYGFKEGPVY